LDIKGGNPFWYPNHDLTQLLHVDSVELNVYASCIEKYPIFPFQDLEDYQRPNAKGFERVED